MSSRLSTPVICALSDEAGAALADVTPAAATVVRVGRRELEPVLAQHPGKDVVLVTAPCRVAEGWLDRLQAAAHAHDLVATASPTSRGPLQYVRRAAIDLVGGIGDDFLERCAGYGLQHVLVDDVLLESDVSTGRSGEAMRPLTVTIDGRCLVDQMSGIEVHTLELIGALAQTRAVELRVAVPRALGPAARAVLDGMPQVARITQDEIAGGAPRGDVIHRPHQITSQDDLDVLRALGERVVVTNHDLIGYRTAAYHATADDWHAYRELTREALAVADVVVFGSRHAADDALADDLVSPQRARVVPLGVDHQVLSEVEAPSPPAMGDAPARPFLLCLGADYMHKNRLFALRLLEALVANHGWDGELVLAGPSVPHGGSRADEQSWLAAKPSLAERVRVTGSVSEGEKAWLYANAAAVAYPTVYEGFGMVPFEAAYHGTPSLWAPVTSLADVLPRELALLEPWDPAASADRVIEILRDDERRDTQVKGVLDAARSMSWERVAGLLIATYREAVRGNDRYVGELHDRYRTIQRERNEWEGRYWHLHNQIGPAGLALVGPDQEAALPDEARRTLAALAGRSGTRRLLLAALRVARRFRGSRRSGAPRD